MWTELILAIQFLTRIPTPQVKDFQPERLAATVRWFPLVGLLLGGCLLAVVWPASLADPWLAGWLGILGWVLLTGGLHLDGLADLADALGAAHRDPSRMLAVMKDPHLGSFGVLTLILAVGGKAVLLMLLARQGHWWGLVLVPAWSRLGVLYWQTLPPLAPGLAEAFSWQRPRLARAVWLVLLLLASAATAPALLLMPLVIGLYRYWLQRAVGGMSGDCLGAGVEVSELAALILLLGDPGRSVLPFMV